MQNVCDDDSKEAKKNYSSTRVDHWVEHSHRYGCGIGEVGHLLENEQTTFIQV